MIFIKLRLCTCVAQSCLTLWDPTNCNLPGFFVMEFSRQEYWSGMPFPSPEKLRLALDYYMSMVVHTVALSEMILYTQCFHSRETGLPCLILMFWQKLLTMFLYTEAIPKKKKEMPDSHQILPDQEIRKYWIFEHCKEVSMNIMSINELFIYKLFKVISL